MARLILVQLLVFAGVPALAQKLDLAEYLERMQTAPGSTLEERMEYLRNAGFTLSDEATAELYLFRASLGSKRKSEVRDLHPSRVLTGDKISCTFERTLNVAYEGQEIVHEGPHKESSPGVDIFTRLNSDSPKVSYLGALGTAGEENLQVVARSEDKIVLLRVHTGKTTITLYTIFPKTGIGIWTKHTNFWNPKQPHATLSMGKCQ